MVTGFSRDPKPVATPAERQPVIVAGTDLVPADWCDGDGETVAEWGVREYESGLRNGVENGVKIAVARIRQLAGDRFVAGDDAEARLLRTLADTIAKEIS